MSKILRYLLIALLLYFLIVYPTEAADFTRRVVGGAIGLFTVFAQSVAQFLRSITA